MPSSGHDRLPLATLEGERAQGASCALSADGTLHRELKLKTDVNGKPSEGTVKIDIAAPPPATK